MTSYVTKGMKILAAVSLDNVQSISCHPSGQHGSYYKMMCQRCAASYEWVGTDFTKAFGVDLDVLIDWCEGHRHEEIKNNIVEFPKLEPYIPGYNNYYKPPDVFGGSHLGTKVYPQVSAYNPAAEIVNSIPVYKAYSMSLDQMAMKKVWQWSGFNVDLQAKQGSYQFRALCKCGVSIPLIPDNIINNDPLAWADLKTFCEDHRFCGTGVQSHDRPTGRKFKNG